MNISGSPTTTTSGTGSEVHDHDASLIGDEQIAANTPANQSGNRAWSISLFFAVAIPLAFGTIVVPLIVGPAFRQVAQSAKERKKWWRCLVIASTIMYSS